MTAALFVASVTLMATIVVALIARYVNVRSACRVLAGLVVWFVYIGLIGYFRIVFVLVPVAFPLWIILGTQSFRIGVELFLHQLTFEGANGDIYVGVLAPLVAWLSTRGGMGMKLALTWNVPGLFALANVVARAEAPDLTIGMFPFLLIPGFFAPLAVTLHVLALTGILSGTFGGAGHGNSHRLANTYAGRDPANL